MKWLPTMVSQEQTISTGSLQLTSHCQITWLRDSAGVFIFNRPCQKYWLLVGLEADLWDWFVPGYPLEQISKWVTLLTDVSEEEARLKVLQSFHRLVQDGVMKLSVDL